MIKLKAAGKIS